MTSSFGPTKAAVVYRDDPSSAHLLKVWSDTGCEPHASTPALILPLPNCVAGTSQRTAWLAPGEYLVRNAQSADLAPLAIDGPWLVAELTHGLASFVISGPQARAVLAKGCTLDLHPSRFGLDSCARTRFAQVRTLIEQISADAFRLTIEAPFAHYLQAWLADALLEFEHPLEPK